MIIEKSEFVHKGTICVSVDASKNTGGGCYKYISPQQAREKFTEGLRLTDEIEAEEKSRKDVRVIRRGDTVVLDWGADALIIPVRKWWQISEEGDNAARDIEVGKKTPEEQQSLAAMAKLGILLQCKDRVISIYWQEKNSLLQHEDKGWWRVDLHDLRGKLLSFAERKTLPAAILTIEED